jgi:ribosomal protein S18 acetylase RimI-like enzyme
MASTDRLTFLVDSNVFITLEPHIKLAETEPYQLAARFIRQVQDHGHLLAIHEATREEIYRDEDLLRRAHSMQALEKYRVLEGVPISQRIAGSVSGDSENDRIDSAIASALDANAAHFLVTEDRRLRKRIQSVAPDLEDRVRSLVEAVEFLDAIYPEPKTPPPLVELVPCYQLSVRDPIFESIREDYDGFDEWFGQKCQLGQRNAYVIRGDDEQVLAALCILKDEDESEYGLPMRRMKLCTLKVAEPYRGQRLGELLIKAALEDAVARKLNGLSVTVFEHHEALLGLLFDLGFAQVDARTALNELVLFRSVKPPADALTTLDPFDFNRQYGPWALNLEVPMHIVPIQPRWEERLFPEGTSQLELLGGPAACGNGLRKAYLTRSPNRRVHRGDLALFYRSEDMQAVRFIAVVEDTLASDDYREIARFVGTRTVYTVQEIQVMTENGVRTVNAILMRQARRLEPPWELHGLITQQVVRKAPQSIQRVSEEEGAKWIRERLAE